MLEVNKVMGQTRCMQLTRVAPKNSTKSSKNEEQRGVYFPWLATYEGILVEHTVEEGLNGNE